MYYAIIGDIVNSKKLENRFDVQINLKQVLEQVNDEYASNIYSCFSITLGDEFQGLLDNAECLLEIIDVIRCKMYPVKIRFGIGVGSIVTPIERSHSLGSDGPAYWCARKAIMDVHENNDYGHTMTRIMTETATEQTDLINNSLRVCDWMFNSWTEPQRKFVSELIPLVRYSKFQQKEIAGQLNLKPQAINHKIQHTGVLSYIAVRKSLSETINAIR